MLIRTVPRSLHKKATGSVAPVRPGLDVEPDVIVGEADKITALAVGLGVKAVDAAAQEAITLEVDPHAAVVAGALGPALKRVPLIEHESGQTGDGIVKRRAQLNGMLGLYGTALEVASDVLDSRTLVATRARTLREGLGELARRVLAGEEPALAAKYPGLVEKVRARYKVVQLAEDKYKAAQAARVSATRKQTGAAKAELGAAGRREDLLRTMLDLRNNRPVDAARAAAAVKTYDDLQAQDSDAAAQAMDGGDAENRRTRSR